MKKVIVLPVLLIMVICQGFCMELDELVDKYNANQQKIKTIVTVGTITTTVKNAADKTPVTQTINMKMIIKFPDCVRFESPEPLYILVIQKGEEMIRKIGKGNAPVKEKVNKANDMLKNYYNKGIAEYIVRSNILSAKTIKEKGETLYQFRFKTTSTAELQIIAQTLGVPKIDEDISFFSANGMLVRKIYIAKGKELARLDSEYEKKDGILIVKSIKTKMEVKGTKMETIISYTNIKVNTEVSDKEFELE